MRQRGSLSATVGVTSKRGARQVAEQFGSTGATTKNCLRNSTIGQPHSWQQRNGSLTNREGAEVKNLEVLRVKIFADGADKAGMLEMYGKPHIRGLTTNPTLMKKAGVQDYKAFAKDVLTVIRDKPVSFEVFSDDFAEMERQAMEIARWGDNIYVKIPVTNTRRESAASLVRKLSGAGVKLNVTALMTLPQVREITEALAVDTP